MAAPSNHRVNDPPPRAHGRGMAGRYLGKKTKQALHPEVWPTCRVMLKFDGPKIVAIEPGQSIRQNAVGPDRQGD